MRASNVYEGTTSSLYLGDGKGNFMDVSQAAGIGDANGRAMGMVAADYDGDGRVDLYVSSDMMPSLLFMNQGMGLFKEQATVLGCAYGSNGIAHAGMGVDCGDYDNDGHIDLVVTNFKGEPNTLFRNLGDGQFAESSRPSGLAAPSTPHLSWGVRFVDLNLDGWLDLFVASGHVNDYDENHNQPCQVYINRSGVFTDISHQCGSFFQDKQVARGAAFGDFDNDGDIDVLLACNNQPLKLLRNDSLRDARVLRLQLRGDSCNRDALGARVRVHADPVQTAFVRSGGSYLCDHDRRLIFAVGDLETVSVEIRWPCGNIQEHFLSTDVLHEIVEDGCHCSGICSEH
jgi:enediyne biosynthesis protein E4